ncbi:hypothetical protein Dimus_020102, partial [Dionaea muscipula]
PVPLAKFASATTEEGEQLLDFSSCSSFLDISTAFAADLDLAEWRRVFKEGVEVEGDGAPAPQAFGDGELPEELVLEPIVDQGEGINEANQFLQQDEVVFEHLVAAVAGSNEVVSSPSISTAVTPSVSAKHDDGSDLSISNPR